MNQENDETGEDAETEPAEDIATTRYTGGDRSGRRTTADFDDDKDQMLTPAPKRNSRPKANSCPNPCTSADSRP